MCEQAERIISGEVDRLILVCPPQHGKSDVFSRRLSAFMLGLDPTLDIISVSAGKELAADFGRDVRDCIDSYECRNVFPDLSLAEDSQAQGRWHTNKGGSYYAVGIGGKLFGRGGLAIIDDPFGSWEEAQSDRIREKVWSWYTGTLYNRVRPGQPIIVIQHRLHEDDLVGRLLQAQDSEDEYADRWEIVRFPADPEDPPWEEKYDRQALLRIKANTPPNKWNALYLGNPVPDEGIYFKRDWFWRYKIKDMPPVRKYITSDFAVTDAAEADDPDFTEIGVHGAAREDGNTKLYLCLDGWSGQKAPEDWADEYFSLVLRHKPMCEFAEVGVIRRAVEGRLKQRRLERKAYGRIEWVSHIGDKAANARALQSMASMGLVGLPDNDYGEYVLAQLLKFPAGKFDDAVDMCALMARAVDEAFPMLVPAPEKDKKRDAWDDAFDDYGASNWKTA